MNDTHQTTMSASDWLAYRGRYVNVSFLLRRGETDYVVTIRDGRVTQIRPGPHVMPRWTFALVAGDDDWNRFWAPTPQPRFHDLMAMVRFKTLRIEGDQAIFMSNLLYFKDLISQLGSQLHAR
ncbi:hypothetical protein SGO26_27695 [Cupriavidus metallidurans]|uniref:hypothetical protein n=1 Tax=Cupriavidus TaxID=106589 RepID=UPI0002A2F0A5|nr:MULTISPECIES: hypothetical protein [Cupriavidus]ELA01305.1 hypothetical protein D769_01332 [Cupriavidus sp. HMR-1]GMG92392.1 hypothetical protein Cmtc_36120 [Cupriavidus sp. TKC]